MALVQGEVSGQPLTTAHAWLRIFFSPFVLTSSKNREDLGRKAREDRLYYSAFLTTEIHSLYMELHWRVWMVDVCKCLTKGTVISILSYKQKISYGIVHHSAFIFSRLEKNVNFYQ